MLQLDEKYRLDPKKLKSDCVRFSPPERNQIKTANFENIL